MEVACSYLLWNLIHNTVCISQDEKCSIIVLLDILLDVLVSGMAMEVSYKNSNMVNRWCHMLFQPCAFMDLYNINVRFPTSMAT